jgi:hypothetical protein
MTASELLRKAADLPLADDDHHDPGSWYEKNVGRVWTKGGGVICALKQAAGDDLNAFQEAQGVLDEYCDPIVPLYPHVSTEWPMTFRGRLHSAISEHCAPMTPSERRAFLLEMSERC